MAARQGPAPGSVDAGSVKVGTSTSNTKVHVTNSGGADLSVTGESMGTPAQVEAVIALLTAAHPDQPTRSWDLLREVSRTHHLRMQLRRKINCPRSCAMRCCRTW